MFDNDVGNAFAASKWNELYKKGAAYKPLNAILLSRILNKVSELTGKYPETAIDFGCGTGDSLVKLREAGITDTVGVDCSRVALDEAKGKLATGTLVPHDLDETESLDLGVRKFDLVLCKLTVAFLKDRSGFLDFVKSILSENGAVCVITPVLHDGIEYSKEDKPGIAVKYGEFYDLLKGKFARVVEFDHDYFGDKGDTVTFIATE